jgi:hypothetical protein
MGKLADSFDSSRVNVLRAESLRTDVSCCARILLSVLRTLVHGAFPWLQPRSPVGQKVVESAPDPPDAVVVVLENGQAAEARAERASLRAVAAAGSPLRLAAKAALASPPVDRAVARRDAKAEAARAAAGKAAAAGGKAVAARAVPGVRAGALSPRLLASSALRRASSNRPPGLVSALSTP